MNKIVKALFINTILPGTSKSGQKIKTKKTFAEIYKAIDDGKIWITNGDSVIGYPITEYSPAEICWVYISEENGVSIRPVPNETPACPNNGWSISKADYDYITKHGQKLIDDMFGDILDMIIDLNK